MCHTAPALPFRTFSYQSGNKDSPIEIPKHERRRHPRYRAPKSLLVAWQGAGKRNVSNAEEMGVGGAFLLVAHPLSAGTHVELLFDVTGGEVRARAIVRATTFFDDPKVLMETSEECTGAMKGLAVAALDQAAMLQTRGW